MELATGVAAAAIMLCVQPASANENFGSLQGMVKNAAGQPVSGAFVRLKNADKRLSFMVISQNGGAFAASDLPPGNYTVQAIERKKSERDFRSRRGERGQRRPRWTSP